MPLKKNIHCAKCVPIPSFSGPYFATFGLKIYVEISETFQAVIKLMIFTFSV